MKKFLKIIGVLFFISFIIVAIKGFVVEKVAIINESETQKIARGIVEQEMERQEGLKDWEITQNEVFSDNNVHNLSDYEKPVGDMRIVRIEGNVNLTTDAGNSSSESYNLELYQMKGDDKWYIGTHWGVLRYLEVTEEPENQNPDNLQLSESDDISSLFTDTTTDKTKEAKAVDTSNTQSELPTNNLIGAWYWGGSDDYFMILRSDNTYSYIEKSYEFISEGTYTVEKVDDHFEVNMYCTTGERDSLMSIQLIDEDHIEASEGMETWAAERINLEDGESILGELKTE